MTDGDLTCGGEHTIECTDDVLQNCAPETCIILSTSATPTNSIKSKNSVKLKLSLVFYQQGQHPPDPFTGWGLITVQWRSLIHVFFESTSEKEPCLFTHKFLQFFQMF